MSARRQRRAALIVLIGLLSSSAARGDGTSSALSMSPRLAGGLFTSLHDLGFVNARESWIYHDDFSEVDQGAVNLSAGRAVVCAGVGREVRDSNTSLVGGLRLGGTNRFGLVVSSSRARRESESRTRPGFSSSDSETQSASRAELSYARVSEDERGFAVTVIGGVRGTSHEWRRDSEVSTAGGPSVERELGGRIHLRSLWRGWEWIGEAEYVEGRVHLGDYRQDGFDLDLSPATPDPLRNVYAGAHLVREVEGRWRVHLAAWVDQTEKLWPDFAPSAFDFSITAARTGAAAVGAEYLINRHFTARLGGQESWVLHWTESRGASIAPDGHVYHQGSTRDESETLRSTFATGIGFHTGRLELNGAIYGAPSLNRIFGSVDFAVRI